MSVIPDKTVEKPFFKGPVQFGADEFLGKEVHVLPYTLGDLIDRTGGLPVARREASRTPQAHRPRIWPNSRPVWLR